MTAEHRFYGELAAWWPLISPAQEYAEEAAEAAALLPRRRSECARCSSSAAAAATAPFTSRRASR